MNNLNSIAIMTHSKRDQELEAIRRLIELQAKPLGIPVLIARDEGWNSPRLTLRKALTMGEWTEGYRLVLHDDLVVPKGCLTKLSYILEKLPNDGYVSAYCPSNKGYNMAVEREHHVLRTASNIWAQAIAYRHDRAAAFVEYMDENSSETYRWEDRTLCGFLKSENDKMTCVVPSLFQHLGAFRSTLGFPGKVGGRLRYSDAFQPNFDPTKVDWEYEAKVPYLNEVPVDMKGVLK